MRLLCFSALVPHSPAKKSTAAAPNGSGVDEDGVDGGQQQHMYADSHIPQTYDNISISLPETRAERRTANGKEYKKEKKRMSNGSYKTTHNNPQYTFDAP